MKIKLWNADRFKDIRLRAHMTQAQFARALGVPRQQVWNWEKGLRSPGFESYYRLCKRLNIDMSYLITPDPDLKGE
jgi:transcriptional regulator with XRE-family HTH domain